MFPLHKTIKKANNPSIWIQHEGEIVMEALLNTASFALGFISVVISILGTSFAWLAWEESRKVKISVEKEKARNEQTIKVFLQCGDEKIFLPVDMLRKDFTRAELLGRIGMIPMKKNCERERFSIAALNTNDFLERLNRTAKNSGGDEEFPIICTKEEFDRFDAKPWNRKG
ncbi:hypothetical protein LJC71_09795 [Desulfosarcina sp. OttesenSCG-928-A07]|nr:hypothetical protein [Desulfosarcina sp. OttesenSCG-928-G17]MDL2330011.1 hypothetical protein [Desulfosarcina sp. OttesenSCG-928-A07]